LVEDGLVHINANTKSPTAIKVVFMDVVTELTMKIGNVRFSPMNIVPRIFAGRRITPFFCQSIIGFDRVGCVISQWWNLSDPRAKQAAAKRRNGVVGSRGVTIPIAPMRTKRHPKLT
jgi:hypothetical protein